MNNREKNILRINFFRSLLEFDCKDYVRRANEVADCQQTKLKEGAKILDGRLLTQEQRETLIANHNLGPLLEASKCRPEDLQTDWCKEHLAELLQDRSVIS